MVDEAGPLVAVIDDDASVRRGLSRLLRSEGYGVEEFDSGPAFLASDESRDLDCVILDIWMPGMTGTEAFEQIVARWPAVPVIFLTAHDDVPTSVRAIKRGAVDFLVKPAEEVELLGAVRSAVARRAVSRERAREREALLGRLSTLSPREREVMQRVALGHLNKVIAADLGISEKTVKVHRHRVMEKTRADSVAELVRLVDAAAAAGPPDPDP